MLELNKIYNMNCIEGMKLIEDESVDLIIVDPPYYKIVKENWDHQWETKQEYLEWCKKWIVECKRVLKESGSFYIWGGVGEKSDTIIHLKLLIDDIGLYFKDWITWKKRRGMGNRKGWLYTREEILWYVKNNKKFVWNKEEQYNKKERNQFKKGFSGYKCLSEFKRFTNIWTDVPEILGNKKINHLTPKPIEAIERIIKVHTKENDVVLDCFMGSGTTAVAAKELNRNFIGFEINKEYVEIANKRLMATIVNKTNQIK